ncbi:MAG: PEGA domain-containing protein [Myxococcota bacterium]|nr:PEGA domain-containing protein [Myxococcota bacterium]
MPKNLFIFTISVFALVRVLLYLTPVHGASLPAQSPVQRAPGGINAPRVLEEKQVPRLFVAPVTSRVLNAESRDFLEMILLQEIAQHGLYNVLSFKEIDAALDVEKVKDQLGCTDVVCLSEIGMALGGAEILQAEVKKVKKQKYLTLAIVESLAIRTSNRALVNLPQGFAKWKEAVAQAVAQLLGLAVESRIDVPPAPTRVPAPSTTLYKGTGFLSINTSPWTEISIDGEPFGVTPLFKIRLKAGKHRLRLNNPQAGIARVKVITIEADKTQAFNLKL